MEQVLVRLLRRYLSDPQFHIQILLFLGLAGAAWLLARQLRRAQWSLPGWRWQESLQPFYFPLFGLLGGRLIEEILNQLEWSSLTFRRLYALFWILLFYRLAVVLVRKIAPESAPMIRQRILLPLAILFVILRLAGQLSLLLALSNQIVLFRVGEGEDAFTLTLSLLIFGPLTLILLYVIAQGVRTLLVEDILPSAGLSESRSYATGTLIGYVILFVGVLMALAALGIDLTTLAVFGSALAVGIGFGLQDTINNLVSGFLLMFDPSINVGDTIEVANERGVIRRVGIRNTVIEALDGTQIIMPNATLSSSPVLNLTYSRRPVKVTTALPVAIGADPHEVEEVVMTILAAHPDVRETPTPTVTLQSFGQGIMNFQIEFWADHVLEKGNTTNAINLAIWEQMQERGYELAPVTVPGMERVG
ncbi:MAG: mechanosensitive ion channel [Chloroflexota bacterium]|nr:mechanosensitive ion channel [Chloroflexota bacterium]